MSIRRSPKQWRSILNAFHRSGQSQAQFCSEHELSIATFRYQLSRERSRSPIQEVEPSALPRLIEVTARKDLKLHSGSPSGSLSMSEQALRIELSLDSRALTLDCRPGQLVEVLDQLAAFHDHRKTPR